MKIITICGSLKYQKEIMEIAEKLGKEGNCILTLVYPVNSNKEDYTEEEIKIVRLAHFERIKLSDAIFVVNIDNYIGESMKIEIEYAKSLDKKIIYYTDLVKTKEEKKSANGIYAETFNSSKERHILPPPIINKSANRPYIINKDQYDICDIENFESPFKAKLRKRNI